MDIILKKNVDGLGEVDDLVTVKSGYGRNYLIPSGNAILATVSAKKIREENLRQRSHKIEKVREEAKAAAEKLAAITVKIGAKVGENGKIFGSVTNLQVADAIKALGFEVERKTLLSLMNQLNKLELTKRKLNSRKVLKPLLTLKL